MTIYNMDYEIFVEQFKLAKKQHKSASKWVDSAKGRNRAIEKGYRLQELAIYGIKEGWVDKFWNLIPKTKGVDANE